MRYIRAKNSQHAVSLMAGAVNPELFAGGTDVLVKMKLGGTPPDLLIDLKHIAGMREIRPEAGGIRVGAAVTGAEMGESAVLQALWPGVVEAVELIGSTQVQGRATMVGNLCNGSPAADSVPALLAAAATVRILGAKGERDLPVADVLEGPGKTTLNKSDIVTSIFLPARPERAGDAYLRFIPRTEMDIAVAGAAISLSLDEAGVVLAANVALGAVAPTAVLVPQAAKALIGSRLEAAALDACARACRDACAPIDDRRGTVEFRTKLAGVLATRAAKTAYIRAGGSL